MTIIARASLSATILVAIAGLARSSRAADICGEMVPSTRVVDGIPAYAQCAASASGAIYSNDGVATSTTSAGASWVRTQVSGGYQCTELAHRYLSFQWNVAAVPDGNAGVWCDAALPSGLAKATTPVHGDLIVFAPGSCGADATAGHVAVIDVVNTDATVTAVEQNVAGRSRYKLTCAACFLHAIANAAAGNPDAGADASSSADAAGAKDAADAGAGGGTATPRSDAGTTQALGGSGGGCSVGGEAGSGAGDRGAGRGAVVLVGLWLASISLSRRPRSG